MSLRSFCRRKSPWVMYMSCGGCNGCDIEVKAALTPRYDIERFGAVMKYNPRHSDVLLVTGIVTKQIESRLKRIYEQMPNPKTVVAVGSCPAKKCVFYDSYNAGKDLDKLMPVDVYVPGCPPKPEAIIDGLIKASRKLGEKK